MGRHGSQENNFRLAPWIWWTLLAILAVIALTIGWSTLRSANTTAVNTAACAEGDYVLQVWSDPTRADALVPLVDAYNASSPIVRDQCIQAQITPIADAEALAALDSGAAPAPLWAPADVHRAVTDSATRGSTWAHSDIPRIAEDTILLALSATATSEGKSSEQDVRSATDFAAFARSEPGVSATTFGDLGITPPLADAAPASPASDSTDATPAPAEGEGAPAASGPAELTILLDTSGSMGLIEGDATRLDNVRGPLADALRAAGERGGTVSLWNYSSPLSPAARTPYRPNVPLEAGDHGEQSAAVLNQLGFGGATHTYSSVTAAYAAAVDYARAHPERPSRVLLVTDGPNDGGAVDLAGAVTTISDLYGQQPVRLDVLAIGDRVDQPALDALAQAGHGTVHTAPTSLEVPAALKAAGL